MTTTRSPFTGGDSPFAQFMRRVSLSDERVDFIRAFNLEWRFPPLSAFALFRHYDEEARAAAIAALELEDPLECSETVSTAPVHDGFIALLEFRPAESARDHLPRLAEFFEREERRNVEEHLRTCYGRDYPHASDDGLFSFMDFPVFDNGSGGLGYGVMVPADRAASRWLWSRVSFAHK